jgi:uncharacterized membrane protein
MADAIGRSAHRQVSIFRHPIYNMLLPVPVICFLGVVLTDLTYLKSGGNLIWLAFSSWLLLFGLAFGVLGAVVLLLDFIRSPAMRSEPGWLHLLLFCAALVAELFSIFIHERDGWTAVAGLGLTLSIIGALLILIAAWVRRFSDRGAR